MDTIELRIKERMSREIKMFNFFKYVDVRFPKRNEYCETKRTLRFFEALFETKMDLQDESYRQIKEYIDRTESQYPETIRFEELFDDYDVEKDKYLLLHEYIVRTFSKFPGVQAPIFSTSFVNGITYDFKARERLLKENIPYIASENVLLIHDATFFANYSKGFLVTEKIIVDLKTKQGVAIDEIVDCVMTKSSVDVLSKSNRMLSFSIGNPIIGFILESIIKCYSSYKGKLFREETDKLNAEIAREEKIKELMLNSTEKCFEKGMDNISLNNNMEAELYFIAMERNSDTDNMKMLCNFGQGLCCIEDIDKSVNFIDKAMEYKADIKEEVAELFKKILNYINNDGKGILSAIIQNGNLEAFNFGVEFVNDVNITFNNATMLDLSVYNRKINRAKTDNYKEIEEILINKGCERKWDVEFNRKYIQISNIQELIKQSIFKCIERSNNEIKVGEDLRRAIPDKCQKAAMNLGIKYENAVYLIYDNTTFKSLKSGFAICSDGIYIASDIGEHLFIPWEMIIDSQIAIHGGNVFFEGAKLMVSPQNAPLLYNLFDDLKYELREYGLSSGTNKGEKVLIQPIMPNVGMMSNTPAMPNAGMMQSGPAIPNAGMMQSGPAMPNVGMMPNTPAMPNVGMMQNGPAIPNAGMMPNTPTMPNVGMMPNESVMINEPIMPSEPMMVEEPVIINEPIMPSEPMMVEEPVIINEPVILSEPIIQEISLDKQADTKDNNKENIVLCSNCGEILVANAKFCKKCGTKVDVVKQNEQLLVEEPKITAGTCPNCSTINVDIAKFCKKCGFKLK